MLNNKQLNSEDLQDFYRFDIDDFEFVEDISQQYENITPQIKNDIIQSEQQNNSQKKKYYKIKGNNALVFRHIQDKKKYFIKKLIFGKKKDIDDTLATIYSIINIQESQVPYLNPTKFSVDIEYIKGGLGITQFILLLYYPEMKQSIEDLIVEKQQFNKDNFFLKRDEKDDNYQDDDQQYIDFFSSQEIKDIFYVLYTCLRNMHERGQYHYNIKPSNIIQARNLKYYLFQGGIQSQNQSTIYEAPECKHKDVNRNQLVLTVQEEVDYFKADIYSLGMTMLKIASMEEDEDLKIFNQSEKNQDRYKIEQILEKVTDRYGVELTELLRELLYYNPEDRPFIDKVTDYYERFAGCDDIYKGQNKNYYIDDVDLQVSNQIFDNIISKIRTLKKKPEQYFAKYEYRKNLKQMNIGMFYRAIMALGVNVTSQEIQCLNRVLDPFGKDYYDMTKLVDKDEIEKYKENALPELKETDELLLKQLLEKIYKWDQENPEFKIEQDLIETDLQETSSLSLRDFQLCFQQRQFDFKPFELKVIEQKFDLYQKKQIYYREFIKYMIKVNTVDELELDDMKQYIFNIIIDRFITLESGFNTIMRNKSKGYLDREDLIVFFEESSLDLEKKIQDAILENMDPNETNKIFFLNFVQKFETYSMAYSKKIILELMQSLQQNKIKFTDLMEKFRSSGTKPDYITIERLNKALLAIKCQVRHKQISFIIGYYGIEKSIRDEINYQQLREYLYQDASEFNFEEDGDLNFYLYDEQEKNKKTNQNQKNSKISTQLDGNPELVKKSMEILEKLSFRITKYKTKDVLAFFEIEENKDKLMNRNDFKSKVMLIDSFISEKDAFNLFATLDDMGVHQISSLKFLTMINFNFDQDNFEKKQQKNVGYIDGRKIEELVPLLSLIKKFLNKKKQLDFKVQPYERYPFVMANRNTFGGLSITLKKDSDVRKLCENEAEFNKYQTFQDYYVQKFEYPIKKGKMYKFKFFIKSQFQSNSQIIGIGWDSILRTNGYTLNKYSQNQHGIYGLCMNGEFYPFQGDQNVGQLQQDLMQDDQIVRFNVKSDQNFTMYVNTENKTIFYKNIRKQVIEQNFEFNWETDDSLHLFVALKNKDDKIIINSLREITKLDPQEYFHSSKINMNIIDFRYKLMDLKLNMNALQDEIQSLIELIQDQKEKQYVDTSLFLKILNSVQEEKKTQGSSLENLENQNVIIGWFVDLVKQMDFHKISFSESFGRYKQRLGRIKQEHFEHVVFRIFGMERTYYFYFVVKYLQDLPETQSLNLEKLKLDIEREYKAKKQIQQISIGIRDQLESIMQMYNIDGDDSLSLDEFKQCVTLSTPDIPFTDIKYIFQRIDQSGDNEISFSELKYTFWGIKDNKQKADYFVQPWVQEIQVKMREHNLNFKDVFYDKQELKDTGVMDIDQFKERMTRINYDYTQKPLEFEYIIKELRMGEKDIVLENLERFYEEYKQQDKSEDIDNLLTAQQKLDIKVYTQQIQKSLEKKAKKHPELVGPEGIFQAVFLSKQIRDKQISKHAFERTLSYDLGFKEDDFFEFYVDYMIKISNLEGGLIDLEYLERQLFQIKKEIQDLYQKVQEQSKEKEYVIDRQVILEITEFIYANQVEFIKQCKKKDTNEGAKHYLLMETIQNIMHDLGYYITENQLISFAKFYGCIVNKRINYLMIVEESKREGTSKQSLELKKEREKIESEFKTASKSIIKKLHSKNKTLARLGDRINKKQQGLVYLSDLCLQFQLEKIPLTTLEVNSICDYYQPVQGKIDYLILENKINKFGASEEIQAKNKDIKIYTKQYKTDINEQAVNDALIEFKKAVKSVKKRDNIQLRTLFNRFDSEGKQDGEITFLEFKQGCKVLTRDKIDTENFKLMEGLFKKFKKNGSDYVISYREFYETINDKQGGIHIEPILRKLRMTIGAKGDSELKEIFREIDDDNNEVLSYHEFSQAMERFQPQILDEEKQALFKYFDKDNRKIISYNNFVQTLLQEHMDLEKISAKIQKHLDNEEISLKSFTQQILQNDAFFRYETLDKFLETVGYNFNIEQVKELYDFLDKDKDNKLYYDELEQEIFYQKVNTSKTLRKLRKEILEDCTNLQKIFQQNDISNTGKLSYHQFAKSIKSASGNLKPFEINHLYEKFKTVDKKESSRDYIIYQTFMYELTHNEFDLTEIIDALKQIQKELRCNLDKIFDYYDSQKDRTLEIAEFDQMLIHLGIKYSEYEVKEAFQAFDIDNSGKILLSEFRDVVNGNDKSKEMNLDVMINKQQHFKRKIDDNSKSLDGLVESTGLTKEIIEQQEKYGILPEYDQKKIEFQKQSISPFLVFTGQPDIPDTFNVQAYTEHFVYQCQEQNKDLFNIFIEKDVNKDFSIQSYEVFDEIVQSLNFDMLELHKKQYYQYYQKQGSQAMAFLPICKQVYTHSFLMAKMIKYTITIMDFDFRKFFNEILKYTKNNDEFWSVNELLWYNNSLKLCFTEEEVKKVWNEWSNDQKYMNKIQLSQGSGISLDFNIAELEKKYKDLGVQDKEVQIQSMLLKFDEKQGDFNDPTGQYDVNIVNVFTYFDEGNDYHFKTDKQLKKVFQYYGMYFTQEDIQMIYDYFSNSLGQMQWLKLIFRLKKVNKGDVFCCILKNIMRLNGWDIQEMFSFIAEHPNDVYWGKRQIGYINRQLKLGLKDINILELFKSFTDGGKKETISIKKISEMLKIDLRTKAEDISKKYFEQLKKEVNYLESVCKIIDEDDDEGIGLTEEQRQKIKLQREAQLKNLNMKNVEKVKQTLLAAVGGNVQALLKIFFPNDVKLTLYNKSEKETKKQKLKQVTVDEFIELARKTTNMEISAKEAEEFFNYIDANKNGDISLQEFCYVYPNPRDEYLKENQNDFKIPPKMEEEIYELFQEVDEDCSGYVDKKEMKLLLKKIGIQVDEYQVNFYFDKFDQDKSGTITYDEFRLIMEDFMKKEMQNSDSLVKDIRREFKKSDISNSRCLTKVQLEGCFKNLGVNLSKEELNSLFSEIDKNGDGTVDIDELISFITNQQDGISALASAALIDIKGSRQLSIKDLKSVFESMPSNFISSFIRNQTSKEQLLLSKIFKPKYDETINIYKDLRYVKANFSREFSALERKSYQFNYMVEFKLEIATGIPIPDKQEVPRDHLKKRKVYICLYDTQKKKFIGNSIEILAQWDESLEDQWRFKNKDIPSEELVYLKIDNYNQKDYKDVNLIFEFVTHYVPTKPNPKLKADLEVSCCFSEISLEALSQPGQHILTVEGGKPDKKLQVDPKDIRTERTGFRKVVKQFASNIKSQFKIFNLKNPTYKQDIEDLKIMPSRCLINRNYLDLLTIYREYFAFETVRNKTLDTNLDQELVIKTFLLVVNNKQIMNSLTDFWRQKSVIDSYKSKYSKGSDFKEKKNRFAQMMRHVNILINHQDFQFQFRDTQSSCYTISDIFYQRETLINACLEDLRNIMEIVPGQANRLKRTQENSKPFVLNEDSEDSDDEQNNKVLDQYYHKKIQMEEQANLIKDQKSYYNVKKKIQN